MRVEARAGVVEERVVGVAEREQLVLEPRGLERRLRRRQRGVHARVEPAVDAEDRRARAAEVAARREWAVERRGRGQPLLAGREQAPDHPAAEAEADRAE